MDGLRRLQQIDGEADEAFGMLQREAQSMVPVRAERQMGPGFLKIWLPMPFGGSTGPMAPLTEEKLTRMANSVTTALKQEFGARVTWELKDGQSHPYWKLYRVSVPTRVGEREAQISFTRDEATGCLYLYAKGYPPVLTAAHIHVLAGSSRRLYRIQD